MAADVDVVERGNRGLFTPQCPGGVSEWEERRIATIVREVTVLTGARCRCRFHC